jgi:L-lactate dehydrogenase complex protein LldG
MTGGDKTVEREIFLGRIGQASLRSDLPDPPRVGPELPELADVDLIARFRARAQAVNTVIHGPMSRHTVPRAVLGVATGHEASRFMAWDELPAPGVASALQSGGLDRVAHDTFAETRLSQNLSYMEVNVGVTGADAGLAESGSLVLVHGPGRPRMASIVPDIHIALLEVEQIARSLAHWAHENPGFVTDTTNLVFVTGPSRTGDIEMELNLGVHGPRHLHIVMIR